MNEVLAALCAEVGIGRHSERLPVDPMRAPASPLGGTGAHGFLPLSLLCRTAETTARRSIPQVTMGINYGCDRIRIVNPVRSGSRIRAASTIVAVEEKRPGQFQQSCDIVVEIEGLEKPALTETWLIQFFISSSFRGALHA